MLDCKVVYAASGEHNSQLFAGLGALAAQGRIKASVKTRSLASTEIGTRLDILINGRHRIVYDLSDGGSINPAHGIEEADVYFKRSYGWRAKEHSQTKKIFPFGLNHPVFAPHDWAARRCLAELLSMRPQNAKEKMIRATRMSKILSRALRMNGGRWSSWIDRFSAPPSLSEMPSALLLTQTWDPDTQTDPDTVESWRQLNEMRASCIRLLREQLGPRFLGGLRATSHSIREFPEFVVPKAITRRSNYLKIVARTDVCITTSGLAGSTGWRLPEYLAASRSIVTEPLRFQVPGPFGAGTNYLEMRTPEECVEQVLALMENPQQRLAMMQHNGEYYERFVRPDAIVWNSLSKAASHLGLNV